MALTTEEAAVNTAAIALEAALEAMWAAAATGAKKMFVFPEEWAGVTQGTNLNAKFALQGSKMSKIVLVTKYNTSATSEVWAIPGIDIGRVPLTFRMTNQAGDLS